MKKEDKKLKRILLQLPWKEKNHLVFTIEIKIRLKKNLIKKSGRNLSSKQILFAGLFLLKKQTNFLKEKKLKGKKEQLEELKFNLVNLNYRHEWKNMNRRKKLKKCYTEVNIKNKSTKMNSHMNLKKSPTLKNFNKTFKTS